MPERQVSYWAVLTMAWAGAICALAVCRDWVQRFGVRSDVVGVEPAVGVAREDEAAALFLEHRLSLLRLGFLLSGSREDAEDAVQAAFASFQQTSAMVENPLAYLRRAVVNQVNDSQRRRYRQFSSESVAPTQIPEIDETFQYVLDLDRAQRAVVVLRFYEDMSLVDIASMLDRNESTVRSDLRRALANLKEVMS